MFYGEIFIEISEIVTIYHVFIWRKFNLYQ